MLLTRAKRNFFEDDFHGGTDLCYGLLTGYPCCTTNMHQGWPKFVQNLWYATGDRGLAALIYGPGTVRASVAGNVPVSIREETNYPFEETISFTIQTGKKVSFPLHLRIPGWASEAKVLINGEPWEGRAAAGTVIKINREWAGNDKVELQLPMQVSVSRWAQSSAAVERGPLVYSLKIEEEWKQVTGTDAYGDYYEVFPRSDWNFGLLAEALKDPGEGFRVVKNETVSKYPWNLENTPVSLITKGKKLKRWKLYNNMPGPLPHSRQQAGDVQAEEITLIPYGCSTLRITQFPVVN